MLIEEMHAQVPVITTGIRTISDLVTHGENGLLIPMEDTRSLAEAIEQMASDSAQRGQMAEANFQKGIEFRADVVVTQMLQIIFPRGGDESRLGTILFT